jgi:Tfp pilus assembly protein PilP
MAVDLKKLAVTKQTWALLIVLVLAVIGYCFLGTTDSSPTATATPVVVGVTGSKNGASIAPAQTSVVAVQPVTTTGTVRDPFQVPPAYRQVDKSGMTETVNTRTTVATESTNNTTKPAVIPQLRGTVIGGTASAAILTLGAESRPVRVGDVIGEYRLLAVENDSAILSGPNGSITLRMRR